MADMCKSVSACKRQDTCTASHEKVQQPCRAGDGCVRAGCLYKHPREGGAPATPVKSKTPCTHFAKGACRNGDACKFSHAELAAKEERKC